MIHLSASFCGCKKDRSDWPRLFGPVVLGVVHKCWGLYGFIIICVTKIAIKFGSKPHFQRHPLKGPMMSDETCPDLVCLLSEGWHLGR